MTVVIIITITIIIKVVLKRILIKFNKYIS